MAEESFSLPVLDVVEETPDARTIVLAVPAGAEADFAYAAGQFLTVAVPSALTGVVSRSYSLSSSPVEPGPLRITVKRTVGGYASSWLVDNLRPGDRLRVLPPAGIFTPASYDADLLLFAGGSGVTPVMSIVRTALAVGSGRLEVFYANRDPGSVIFADELAALVSAHPRRLRVTHWLESERGIPSADDVRAYATPYAEWDTFCCGPAPFMAAVAGVLKELGLPRSRRHQEKFVSLGGNPFGDAPVEVVGPVTVTAELAGERHRFDDWDASVGLLDFLEGKGLQPPYSCRKGECSACALRLTEGDLGLRHNETLDEADLAAGFRLACQGFPLTRVVGVRWD